jgi:transposase
MKRHEKKDWAKTVYLNDNLSQKETALRVGVALKTINQWVNKEGWDDLRKTMLVTREKNLKRLYAQLDELNTAIESRAEGSRYSVKGEADTLVKLTSAIKNLELDSSIAEVVNVLTRVIKFVRSADLELAQKLTVIMDDFVKSILK